MFRCLMLLVLAAAARPESKKSPAPQGPKPAPEQQQTRFFEGDWHCEGKAFEVPVQTRWLFKAEANKFWLSARAVEQKTKLRPLPRESLGHWGWDAAGHEFVRVMMDNQGDWERASSPGWTGEDWTWTGEINQADGRKTPMRHTITSNGPREFSDKLELNVDGEWRTAAVNSVCKK